MGGLRVSKLSNLFNTLIGVFCNILCAGNVTHTGKSINLFLTSNASPDLRTFSLDSLLSIQKQRYGINHREIGAAALRYWKFPESMINAQCVWDKAALSKGTPPLTWICEVARDFSQSLFQQALWSKDLLIEAEPLESLVLFLSAGEVDDVIASDSKIRIERGGSAKIHYLVADAGGRCATIEFLSGKLVCHTKDTLPWGVLTNHTYASSLAHLGRFDGFGGSLPVSANKTSLGRFVNAAAMVSRFDEHGDDSSVDYAFAILDRVAQGDYTKWSIVYDIRGSTIHFRTFANGNRRSVALASCDFDCESPVRVLDVNTELTGDVTNDFVPYSYDLNRDLIETAFDGTSFLKSVSSETRRGLAEYPEGLDCVGNARRDTGR